MSCDYACSCQPLENDGLVHVFAIRESGKTMLFIPVKPSLALAQDSKLCAMLYRSTMKMPEIGLQCKFKVVKAMVHRY